jgi:uncharacterized membrane protein YhaH (DUF805 family)
MSSDVEPQTPFWGTPEPITIREAISITAPLPPSVQTGRPRVVMSFEHAIRTCLQLKYLQFNGRASRSEYWWFFLFSFLALQAAAVLDAVVGVFIFYFATVLLLALPTLSACVRRLHDLDRSGWWILIVLIPFIGSLILLIWTVSEGNPFPNQYGTIPTNTGD